MVIFLYYFLVITSSLFTMQENKSTHTVLYRANPKFFVQFYIRAHSIESLEQFLDKKEFINALKQDKIWILKSFDDPKIIAIFLKKNILNLFNIYQFLLTRKNFSSEKIESYKQLLNPHYLKKYEKHQEQKVLRQHINRNEVFDFLWKIDNCTDQELLKYLKKESVINFIQKDKYLFPLALRQTKDPLKLKLLIDHGINLKYEYTTTLLHQVAEKPWLYHYNFLYALMARYIGENYLTSPKKVALFLRYMLDQEKLSAFERAEQIYTMGQKKLYPKGEKNPHILHYLQEKDPEYCRAFTECFEKIHKKRASYNIMKTKYENNSTYLDIHCPYPWHNRKRALALLNPKTWEENEPLFEKIQHYQQQDK